MANRVIFMGTPNFAVPALKKLHGAYQAYQGQDVNIPLITDFVKNQGWA